MTTVRELLKQFEDKLIRFPTLVTQVADIAIPKPVGGARDWATIYQRAEDMPDENSVFWIDSAEDMGILTTQQVERIYKAIARAALARAGRKLRSTRKANDAAYEAARLAVLANPGVSEAASARLLGVDRMTVRKWLGKR